MILKKNKNYSEEKIKSNLELIYSIFRTQTELINSINNYEFADDELIDYYSYHIKATKSKLDYFIKKAKSKGIIVDRIKQIELKIDDEIQVS